MIKRKGIIFGLIISIIAFGFVSQSFAQSGQGKNGSCTAVLNGTPVFYQGIVYSCVNGEGMKVDTTDGIVTVFGLGPVSFWEDSGLTRPTTGDTVTIDGNQILYSNGDQRTVIMSMTVNGTEIVLRDPNTGCPLWRGKGKGKGKGKMKR